MPKKCYFKLALKRENIRTSTKNPFVLFREELGAYSENRRSAARAGNCSGRCSGHERYDVVCDTMHSCVVNGRSLSRGTLNLNTHPKYLLDRIENDARGESDFLQLHARNNENNKLFTELK